MGLKLRIGGKDIIGGKGLTWESPKDNLFHAVPLFGIGTGDKSFAEKIVRESGRILGMGKPKQNQAEPK